ncbi:Ig-like domain-containing protein, partial [Enterobacter cloacae]
MNISAINLFVIDGKDIVQIAELPEKTTDAAVRVKAVKGGKYLLVKGKDEAAPEHIVVKRVGNDLSVFTQDGDDTPEIIIEDFYIQQGELLGMAPDGSYHTYESSDADRSAFLMLGEGENGTLLLSQSPATELTGVTANELSHGMMAAGAVAAVALLTGIVAALNAGSRGINMPVPEMPTGIQAIDNVGIKTGMIAPGTSIDDACPVFSGNGTPGNLIRVYDNDELVGSVVVGADGHWNWQSANALDMGEHSFRFAALSRGKQSEKTSPLEFIVDLIAPDKPDNVSITDGKGHDLSSGGITNTNPLTLSGKGEAGDTVLIYDGARLAGSTVVGEDGQWSAELTLPVEGHHDLQVGFRDPAGNAGEKTGPVGVEYDITPPEAP